MCSVSTKHVRHVIASRCWVTYWDRDEWKYWREGAGARAGCGTGCVVTLPGHLWPLSPFLSVLSGTHTSSICADVMVCRMGLLVCHIQVCAVSERRCSRAGLLYQMWCICKGWTFYRNSLIKVSAVSHTNVLYFWGFYMINSCIFKVSFSKMGLPRMTYTFCSISSINIVMPNFKGRSRKLVVLLQRLFVNDDPKKWSDKVNQCLTFVGAFFGQGCDVDTCKLHHDFYFTKTFKIQDRLKIGYGCYNCYCFWTGTRGLVL